MEFNNEAEPVEIPKKEGLDKDQKQAGFSSKDTPRSSETQSEEEYQAFEKAAEAQQRMLNLDENDEPEDYFAHDKVNAYHDYLNHQE